MDWHDRTWEPTQEERNLLSRLRESNGGQVLLRLIDQQQLDDMQSLGMLPTEYPEEYNTALMFRTQGAYRALEVVKSLLLAEPEPIEEPDNE